MAQSKQSNGPAILITMWTTTSIATLFVVARVYTRIKILRSFALDDFFMISSIIIGLLFVSLTTAAVAAGDGRHSGDLSLPEFERAAMLNTAGFALGIISFVLPKLGVAALLCRIFSPSRRWKIIIWTVVIIGSFVICGCIVIIYAQCQPVRALWTPGVGHCWSPSILVNYSIFAGALSASLDIFLATYPVPILWRLQLPIRKKVILSLAFALGTCAAIMAIVKCTYLPGLRDESDSTYSTSELVIWTNVESNSIITAACIPTCFPLIEILFFGKSIKDFRGGHYIFASRSRYTSFPNPDLDWRHHSSIHEIRGIRRTDEISIWYNDTGEDSASIACHERRIGTV